MPLSFSRRDFLMGAAGLAIAGTAREALAASSGIRYGYAAMTWGTKEREAVDDISSAGYQGIQFRIDATTEFKPAELRELLQKHKLTFVALSSGEISLDAPEAETLAKHTANAQYVRDSGGLYLQVLDQLKAYPRTVSQDECKRLGKLLTELGKRTADLGIPLAYHNHMNTIGERPENLEMVLASSDPKYVKLLLDTAHSVAGGGDPAAAIEKYHDRMIFLHLKDVVDIPKDTPKAKYPFKWVELGRGRVEFSSVFAALRKANFSGWAVIELDHTTDDSTNAKDSAVISRKYLEQKIGVRLPRASANG